jgi:hypothetical protein
MPLSGNQGPRLNRESIEEASRRALNAPMEFDPKTRSKYVKSMVARTIEYLKEGKSVEAIKERLPEFVRDYEHLFEMITRRTGFDTTQLNVMLSMLDHMANGNLTQHDASVIVGKRLYEKFGNTVGTSPS